MNARLAVAGSLLAVAACGRPFTVADEGTPGAGGAAAGPSASGGGGAAESGGGGAAESGGGGEGGAAGGSCDGQVPPPLLHDSALLARYFIDEAAKGTTPRKLVGSPVGPALALSYGTALAFACDGPGHRGLRWSKAGSDARAQNGFGTQNIQALDTSKHATVELVVAIDEVAAGGATLFYLGTPADKRVVLGTYADGGVHFDWNKNPVGLWAGVTLGPKPVVVHVVVDADATAASESVRLYVNGFAIAPNLRGGTTSGVGVNGDSVLVLGNAPPGNSSFRGTLYYGALYGAVLGAAEIKGQVSALAASDDG
jgi:hypothetical protein